MHTKLIGTNCTYVYIEHMDMFHQYYGCAYLENMHANTLNTCWMSCDNAHQT